MTERERLELVRRIFEAGSRKAETDEVRGGSRRVHRHVGTRSRNATATPVSGGQPSIRAVIWSPLTASPSFTAGSPLPCAIRSVLDQQLAALNVTSVQNEGTS